MSTPHQDPQPSHFLVFFLFTVFLCVCVLVLAAHFWLYYISSDELIFFFFFFGPPKGYELFLSCVIILLVNSWSKPGTDTRKPGLQSAQRAS